jgi:hypothetical protein
MIIYNIMDDINRYNYYINGIDFKMLPFFGIEELPSDKTETYIKGVSRLDLISNKYYLRPDLSVLILIANPEFLNENEIPDGYKLRIPFPLSIVKNKYHNDIKVKSKL